MLLGTYEKACKPWSPSEDAVGFRPRTAARRTSTASRRRWRSASGISRRIEQGRHQADHQRPLHLRAGRQPAGRPGAGPDGISGAPARVMAGFSQGGGVGLALSQLDGRTAIRASMSGRMDVARFGEWATLRYTNAKVRENYSRRFSIRFPNEELPAARPQQTTPLYDTMLAQGRGDGRLAGAWKRRSGSRRRASEPKDIVSFHRSNDFAHVGAEVRGRAQARRRHRDRQLRQIRGSPARARRLS